MASGHGYRANRPNTWLLRPTLQVKILLANPEPSTHGPKAKKLGTLRWSADQGQTERARPAVLGE
jgi:hypothetical protein